MQGKKSIEDIIKAMEGLIKALHSAIVAADIVLDQMKAINPRNLEYFCKCGFHTPIETGMMQHLGYYKTLRHGFEKVEVIKP